MHRSQAARPRSRRQQHRADARLQLRNSVLGRAAVDFARNCARRSRTAAARRAPRTQRDVAFEVTTPPPACSAAVDGAALRTTAADFAACAASSVAVRAARLSFNWFDSFAMVSLAAATSEDEALPIL